MDARWKKNRPAPRRLLFAAATAALIALAAAALTGCAAGRDPEVRIAPDTPEQRAYDAMWRASRDVLWQYGFSVDRQDRWAGVITTRPMTGKSILEVWRRDAATSADVWESTFQTIYRAAEVQICRDDAGGYYPLVHVSISRSEKIEPQIVNDSEAQSMFRESPVRRQRKELREKPTTQPDRPVSLGYDAALGSKIAAEIRAAALKRQAEMNR
jgi:hypothetical protein